MIKATPPVVFIVLWSTQAIASGWNDYTSDIGHGFRISKTSSFTVCLGLIDRGPEIICPHPDKGDYGPIDDYAFTDRHLLIKTHGAKLSPHIKGTYTADPDRKHYFIVDKHIMDPYAYVPIGPLDSSDFYRHAAVPSDLQWESSTNPNFLFALLGVILFLGLALLMYGWPIILIIVGVVLFLVVRRIVRRRKEKRLRNA